MDHWPSHARRWDLVGPPLRPSNQDVAFVVERMAGARVAVVLGVTPELVALPWPARVIAVDRAPAVIAALHRGGGAVVADWRALPVASGMVDVVVGDGCLSALAEVEEVRAVAREVGRVLAVGGRGLLRVFAAPVEREALAAVEPGGSFDALKWRIAMAIGERVPVAAIRDAFDARFPDRAELAARCGWAREVIDGIDVYRGSPAVYSFPTLAATVAMLAPELVVEETLVPAYELGERCPTLVVRRAMV